VQELGIRCRPCLTFTPGSLALLARGCLRTLALSCGRLGADTLQHLGCLTGLTQLQVTSDGVDDPGVGAGAGTGAALRHLTALSGLTQLTHLQVQLRGRGEAVEDFPPAAELLAALPRAPLEQVRWPGIRQAANAPE
jgi:hypothetical protein